MVYFLTPHEGVQTPQGYIEPGGLEDHAAVVRYEDLLEPRRLPHGAYVFTGINRLGPKAAQLFALLHEQLEAGTGVRPLNHPLRTLRRYELLSTLHREGLNRFRVFGAWEDYSRVRFPAFVRPRETDGGIPTLVHDLREVEMAVGTALMDGRELHDLVVVEFDDTSVDGLYTKYAAFVIDKRIVPVSLDRGRHWVMRRHATEGDVPTVEAELDYLSTNPHRDQLTNIVSLSGTDFGRLDYSVRDGAVVCWETNTLPRLRPEQWVEPLPPELDARRVIRKEHIFREFRESFQELLARVPRGSGVTWNPDPTLLDDARAEFAKRSAWTYAGPVRFRVARTLARPFKRVLKPIAERTLYPLMARIARRAARSGRVDGGGRSVSLARSLRSGGSGRDPASGGRR